jgi:hypothetical protein
MTVSDIGMTSVVHLQDAQWVWRRGGVAEKFRRHGPGFTRGVLPPLFSLGTGASLDLTHMLCGMELGCRERSWS